LFPGNSLDPPSPGDWEEIVASVLESSAESDLIEAFHEARREQIHELFDDDDAEDYVFSDDEGISV
jgi:hypothetical protein